MRAFLFAVLLPGLAFAAEPAIRGTLDRESVSKAVRARLGEVQACAEAALLRKPGMLPKVVVQFTVGVRGRVTSAQVDGPPPEDARYGECLLDVVRRVKTPPPKGGPVVVRYPFLICGAGF